MRNWFGSELRKCLFQALDVDGFYYSWKKNEVSEVG